MYVMVCFLLLFLSPFQTALLANLNVLILAYDP
jgi:hypothetical protein